MRKLATCAFSFAAAVYIAVYLLEPEWMLYPAVVLAMIGGICIVLNRDWGRRVMLIMLSAAVGLCWTRGYFQLFREPAREPDGEQTHIAATAVEYSDSFDYGSRTVVRLAFKGRYYRTLLYCTDGTLLQPGDTVSAMAELSLADTIWGEETLYYSAKGIVLKANVKGEVNVFRPDSMPAEYLPAKAAHAFSQVLENIYSPDNSAFMKALLLGDRSGLSDGMSKSIQRSGLSHIFVVSGMHIGFLLSFISLLARRRRLTAAIGLPLLVFFAAMIGFTPSVVRSIFMYALVLIAPLLRRESDGLTNLSAALLVLLVINPYSAGDVALQLSFSAAGAITLFSPAIYSWLQNRLSFIKFRRVVNFFAASLSASLGVMVLSTPIVALTYGSISLIAPISNLLTMWAFSLCFILGAVSVLVGLVLPPVGGVVGIGASALMAFIRFAVKLLAAVPFASLSTELPFVSIWLAYIYLIIILSVVMKSKRPWIQLISGVVSLGAVLIITASYNRSAPLIFTALNVGQGQCLTATSLGQTVVVDCGGNLSPDDALYHRLDSICESKIDVFVLTHYHDDHAKYASAIIEAVPTDMVIMPEIPDDTGNRDKIVQAAQNSGTKIVLLSQGAQLDFGCCQMELFAPMDGGSQNEQCLSMVISLDEYDIMITGDMDSKGEALLAELQPLPDCEVLIAGHHGSKKSSSEEFLAELRPELAIISVGPNSYGHPTQETLDRFAAAGTAIKRTDVDGSVTIRK